MDPFTFGAESLASSGEDRYARAAAEQGFDENGRRLH